jgi:hypothetical protein
MSAVDEETGQRMSDECLRDQVLNLLLAGHEVTFIRDCPEYLDLVFLSLVDNLCDLFLVSLNLGSTSGRTGEDAKGGD